MGLLDAPALPLASASRTAVSVAGSSNITLTVAQVRARLLDLTGATQVITIIFPNTTFEVDVRNSGNFDLPIKRSGSSVSLTLHAGAILRVQG